MNEKKLNIKSIIFAGILLFIVSKLPFSFWIFYPFSLLATYLHEASHGIIAIVTGGKLLKFTIEPNGSGLAYTTGGIRFLITSAGYLGTTIWGALLLFGILNKTSERKILISLSLFLLIFTIIFSGNLISFLTGIGFSIFFYLLLKIKNKNITNIIISLISIELCLQSFNDIVNLIFLSKSNIKTDAHALSETLYGIIPPILFAIIWAIISIYIYYLVFKLSIKVSKKS
jgi:uncharacterized membrane protein